MPKEFESKVFKASPSSGSLKTTVPLAVATVLGLEAGDTLEWTVDVEARKALVSRGGSTDPTRGSRRPPGARSSQSATSPQ